MINYNDIKSIYDLYQYILSNNRLYYLKDNNFDIMNYYFSMVSMTNYFIIKNKTSKWITKIKDVSFECEIPDINFSYYTTTMRKKLMLEMILCPPKTEDFNYSVNFELHDYKLFTDIFIQKYSLKDKINLL